MRRVAICMTVGSVLWLCACTAVPDAGTQFDGTYVGTNVVTRGGNQACGPDIASAMVTVSAGRFLYAGPIVGPTPVPVAVQSHLHADGSLSGGTEYFEPEPGLFHGPLAWVTMVGQVTAAKLEAQVDSLNCGRHLSLQRS